MPQFAYRARRRTGELVEGVLEGPDRTAVLAQLERLGLFPVAVDATKAPVSTPGVTKGTSALRRIWPSSWQRWRKRPRKPRLQELATFTHQLANLLQAGMPLTVALHSMTHLESRGIPADVARQLRQEVMEGRSLSDAMAKQPVVFSDLYVNMVRAGEQSGALVEVLRRMADHFERFAQVQARFSSALVYPAFVALVGVAIIAFFMVYMLPKFLTMFEGMQVELPWMTQLLVGISHFFSGYWWLMALVALAVWIVFKRFQATEEGRRRIDQWKLQAPIFGRVVRLHLFATFARTLSTLLENGVPVLTALKITEQVIPNRLLKEAIARAREDVTDGKSLAQPLARSQIFPQLMVDLVKIGEETGDVPGALRNLADTYENELSIALRVMTNMIEPVMIIVMAVGVGFLLLSILSAMFAITSNIAR
ncbi:MAG: type II secretion system F family protein [Verrucomicrobiota bacterium]|nr:type II secretion system F family protein [Limisphaera sp.]MDW8381775.1 type II secretion system F family protein [Verrucomicrobiota bacterium]